MVLKTLCRQEPLHGYAIMTAIEQIGGDALRVEEGSIYPALRRMEQAGWLRAEWVNRDGRERGSMSLTRAGRKQLAAAESQWYAATAAVNMLKMA
jgi:PadR family transcriptional regulator, regulatory protein PadR